MKFFDHVFLISLDDRREAAESRLRDAWIFDYEVIRAFRGDVIGVPSWWRAGGGAWGCYTGHLHALHRAWQLGVESALILEDDVIFAPLFREKLGLLMRNVSDDWGQLYLGGQLRGPTEPVNEFVLRPSRVNRTHAYAVHRNAIPSILRHLMEFQEIIKGDVVYHIDHHLEEAHMRKAWGVYAPTWWLCGQGEASSAVNGRQEWVRWWHNDLFAQHLPLIVCPPGHPQTEGLHFGYNCDKTWCPTVAARMHNAEALRHRLVELKHEALRHGFLPAVSHSFFTMERAKALDTESFQLNAVAYDRDEVVRLANYPSNGLLPTAYYPTPTLRVGQKRTQEGSERSFRSSDAA